MIDNHNIETYLYISPKYFGIYLFDTVKLNNLYHKETKFEKIFNQIDLNILNYFLEDNIFKIEKLTGKFITNIFLVVENSNIINHSFALKKKIYEKNIDKRSIENILTDAKELFKENNQDQIIMHMIINKYLVDGINYLSFNKNFRGDLICIELQVKSISTNFISEINKVLEKYQIKVSDCIDGNYIKNFFKNNQILFSEMIYKIKDGFNENEVKLVPKNINKRGFFEKFFQLFS